MQSDSSSMSSVAQLFKNNVQVKSKTPARLRLNQLQSLKDYQQGMFAFKPAPTPRKSGTFDKDHVYKQDFNFAPVFARQITPAQIRALKQRQQVYKDLKQLPSVPTGNFQAKRGKRYYYQDPQSQRVITPYKKGTDWTSHSITSAQAEASVPLIVRQIVAANDQFGFSGIGPIGKNSFQLYVGRYYDQVTGRTRTMAKPKVKDVNPYNYQSTLAYLQARVLYQWNSFVRATQMYYSRVFKDPSKWTQDKFASTVRQVQNFTKTTPKQLQKTIVLTEDDKIKDGTSWIYSVQAKNKWAKLPPTVENYNLIKNQAYQYWNSHPPNYQNKNLILSLQSVLNNRNIEMAKTNKVNRITNGLAVNPHLMLASQSKLPQMLKSMYGSDRTKYLIGSVTPSAKVSQIWNDYIQGLQQPIRRNILSQYSSEAPEDSILLNIVSGDFKKKAPSTVANSSVANASLSDLNKSVMNSTFDNNLNQSLLNSALASVANKGLFKKKQQISQQPPLGISIQQQLPVVPKKKDAAAIQHAIQLSLGHKIDMKDLVAISNLNQQDKAWVRSAARINTTEKKLFHGSDINRMGDIAQEMARRLPGQTMRTMLNQIQS